MIDYINGWLDGTINRGLDTGNVVLMFSVVVICALIFLLIIRPYKKRRSLKS